MRREDMLVSVRRRKLACVMDPTLVLGSPLSPIMALRLTQVMEPWLTRSFWQVIDASELVLPHLLADDASLPCKRHEGELKPVGAALKEWIALRDSTDAGSWPFRWVGDNFSESQVQDSADLDVVGRYETLRDALSGRSVSGESSESPEGLSPWWDPLQGALDAIGLSAALGGALVLSAQSGGNPPWPVQALQVAGIHSELLDPIPADSLFAAERGFVRDALAAAGLASHVQQLPRLAAVHVAVAALSLHVRPALKLPTARHEELDQEAGRCSIDAPDPWVGAQAWWYFI